MRSNSDFGSSFFLFDQNFSVRFYSKFKKIFAGLNLVEYYVQRYIQERHLRPYAC